MKNSKEYSKKMRELYRSLKAKHPKVKKVVYDDPADAVVYAILGENMSGPAAESAIKKFAGYFIDLNDLRVSQAEEILEVLGQDTRNTKNIPSTLTKALRAIFDEYDNVSLEALKKLGKRPARQVLEKMDGFSRFAVNYCMLTSLQSHAVPLTERMIEYLRDNQLVHPDADEQEIEGFLAKQISAENAYEFYALLRRQSESRKPRKKKKTTRKTKAKTATKTTKKRK
jgi:3-methyladenine DNA glycosylase/8-oxoguanine DNA glycosylase